jgi:hypothetical protein
MHSRWMRSLVFPVCALAGLAACTASPPAVESARPSPGAARLLVEESDLGPQAQKLLENLKSDPFVYFRFINRLWAQATCQGLGAALGTLPDVHLHGDAHVVQYAYTFTDHGLEDLDDSISGPAALDIVRFLGSVDLATRFRGWTDQRESLLDELVSPEELAEVVHDAAAQLGNGHAWTPEDDPGEALRARKLEWLERMEPRMRGVALQLVEDLLTAREVFKAPSPEP